MYFTGTQKYYLIKSYIENVPITKKILFLYDFFAIIFNGGTKNEKTNLSTHVIEMSEFQLAKKHQKMTDIT